MSNLAHDEPGKELFDALIRLCAEQARIIASIAHKVEEIEIGGGSGTGNGFEVYESGKVYKKYQALIDPDTDTPYLVVPYGGAESYTSVTVRTDCEAGNLKLLGFDSQIVTFNHPPTEPEVDRLPENAVVVEYNDMDTPYTGILTSDNTD